MEVVQLVVNDIEIFIKDQPIGLGISKLGLVRDFQYSSIDTTIEAELKFFCASGKTEIDNEFESKGVEGSGYVIITDSCGTNAKNYQFNLDFKKYNNQGDYTTLGLIDANSLWKLELNKEVNVTQDSLIGAIEPFYIRNLPLKYEYSLENYTSHEVEKSPNYIVDINNPTNGLFIHFYPKYNTKINELEDSEPLISESILVYDYGLSANGYSGNGFRSDPLGTITSSLVLILPSFETTPIFENMVEDGLLSIESNGSNQLLLDFPQTANIDFKVFKFEEIFMIGEDYNHPNNRYFINDFTNITATYSLGTVSSFLHTHTNPLITTKTFTWDVKINKGEKLWHFIRLDTGQTLSPTYILQFRELLYTINRTLEMNLVLTKNVSNSISSSVDIEPYHTLTKAYRGDNFLKSVFGLGQNSLSESIYDTDCYNDLWITRGDYLRGKINIADFIVKPSDIFTELEKVTCCGLGMFYDTNPNGLFKLLSVYDFYSDNLVPSKYQFEYNDLIDGKIEIAPFLSPYYKEVQIGYTNSKDSPKDFCKQNNYSINNASDSIYSKVSDFIASMYVITRALRLGTEDKELEFDKNIILLSGTTDSGYNVTLSQTGGYLDDKSQINPTDYVGINRRYSTVFNLFRHLYKWGFSLFADKDKITANKYEGNTIYDNKIRDTSGAMPSSSAPNKADNYFGLSKCYLPYDNPTANDYAPMDKTLEDIYLRYIVKDMYVPSVITFKTANLSSLDLIDMRANQYDLFSVTDGTNMYYGNLISANLEDDITEIKLLRRFKNGI